MARKGLELELHPVGRALEAVVEGQVVRAVGDQETLGAGGREGLDRLADGEMAAGLAVEGAPLEGRLAEEEVGVPREVDELVGWPAVARVREGRGAVRDAEPVSLDLVMRGLDRGHVEPGRREGLGRLVLAELERLVEHRRGSERPLEALEDRAPARREPELRPRRVTVEAEHGSPDPRDEVAPVVEMEVRDRDRVDLWPRLPLPEPRQDAPPAVQKQTASAPHEVARLGTRRG